MTTRVIEETESSGSLENGDLMVWFRPGQDDELRKSYSTMKADFSGADGSFERTIFRAGATAPAAPTTPNSVDSQGANPTLPSGWVATPPTGDTAIWASFQRIARGSTTVTYTTPRRWDGADGGVGQDVFEAITDNIQQEIQHLGSLTRNIIDNDTITPGWTTSPDGALAAVTSFDATPQDEDYSNGVTLVHADGDYVRTGDNGAINSGLLVRIPFGADVSRYRVQYEEEDDDYHVYALGNGWRKVTPSTVTSGFDYYRVRYEGVELAPFGEALKSLTLQKSDVINKSVWNGGYVDGSVDFDALAAAVADRLLPALPILGSRNDKVAKFSGNNLTWEADAKATVILQAAADGGDSAGVTSITLPADYVLYKHLDIALWENKQDVIVETEFSTAILAVQSATRTLNVGGYIHTTSNENRTVNITWNPTTRTLTALTSDRIIYAALVDM